MAARTHARLTTSAVHMGTKPANATRRAQAKQIMTGTAALPGQTAELQVPKVVEGSLLEAPPDSEACTWDVPCLLHCQVCSKSTIPLTRTQVPVLFHHFLCPYSQRSLLAFLEKVHFSSGTWRESSCSQMSQAAHGGSHMSSPAATCCCCLRREIMSLLSLCGTLWTIS